MRAIALNAAISGSILADPDACFVTSMALPFGSTRAFGHCPGHQSVTAVPQALVGGTGQLHPCEHFRELGKRRYRLGVILATSWMHGRIASPVSSSVASATGRLKRRGPALPGLR